MKHRALSLAAAAALAALALALTLPGAARAQDSLAPPGALPHWIPPEDWVYEHWLPYDEGRLYRLLRTDRGAIWRHLRNDAEHDLAQLARRRGISPETLAGRLVAPRRASVSRARLRTLRSRALRTLTQGHLSQHILFHSLHQRTLVDGSLGIFGVRTRRFVELRRQELSPIEIARLHGLGAVTVRRRAVAALRATARRGVGGDAYTPRQAQLLLERQLRQLPRWLGQRRNNGPPPQTADGRPVLAKADWANNPSISADGTKVAFDQYRSTIPEARRLGEIRVVVRDLASGRTTEASHGSGVRPGRPRSAYHSVIAPDGRSVAYELSDGNMNYAKRYGRMRIVVRDLTGAGTERVSDRAGAAGTAYDPTPSADGRLVAFEAAGAATTAQPDPTALWVFDRSSGRGEIVGRGSAGATYEPMLSGDGRSLAFAAADAGTDGRSLVYVRALATGATRLVSRAPGGASADDDAHEPSVSAEGRVVAFTSRAGNLGLRGRRSRIWVHDAADGSVRAISEGTGVYASDPAISADGRFVAFAGRPSDGRGRPSLTRADVWLHDRATGRTTRVSRRAGAGRPAGLATEPAVSGDGARVVFTSTADDLDRRKPKGIPGVFVLETRTGAVRLLSAHRARRDAPLRRPRATVAFACALHGEAPARL